MKKGYFPYFFNKLDHQNYVGPYPDPRFYGVESMMSKDRVDSMIESKNMMETCVLNIE